MNRREFLGVIARAGVAAAVPPLLACTTLRPEDVPATGPARPEFGTFDAWARSYVAEHRIPGASLAIARDGRVLYARGFGLADRATGALVAPESRFRIASVSKPITSVAVLRLVDEGRLGLDDAVLDHLEIEPFIAPGGRFDERWRQVRVRHCLTHTGGWDSDHSYDPMFSSARMAREMRADLPLRAADIVRYQLGQPLDFDPGSRYAYSNLGFAVLGRVIEHVTGQSYEDYVRGAVFAPLAIGGPRIGGSLAEQRAPDEVAYYTVRNDRVPAVIGPSAGRGRVPVAYGSWSVEASDACGGWIASATDLVRFGAAFDLVAEGGATRGGILRPETVRRMLSRQVTMGPRKEGLAGLLAPSYGLGWVVMENRGGYHNGALVCTAAALLHFGDGTNVAFLTNLGKSRKGAFLGHSLAEPLARLVVETWDWPAA
jgi:N-acyl-D-amino-acid deacylase